MLAAATGVAVGQSGPDKTAQLAAKIDASKPKNVILLVGDGMGHSEVTLGRYYGKGAAGRLNMDRLAFRGDSIHYVLRPGPGPTYQPNYVGDSAPTATAWSTGKRTQDGRLSQGPSAADNVPGPNAGYTTYMELARNAGKATGNVSTAEITDATPAAPSSHISQRACQGPADTRTTCPNEAKTAAQPGLGSIAEQQVDQGFDLYLGGGRSRYTQALTAGGTTNVIDYARSKGYTYVDTKQALAGVTSGQKVLGLFNNGNMTTEFAPLYARTAAYYAANPNRDVQVQGGSDTTRCQPQNRGDEPSLPEMTTKALSLLEADKDGFVLQVEGASIDKRDHAADVCGQIGETLAFDNAIGVALDYQAQHPDTLVVVTADHSHTSQMTYTTGVPVHRRQLRDGPDRRQHADPGLLRHRQHGHRRDHQRLPASHRRRGPGVGVRPARGRHPGHDRPDRHLLGADERARAGGRRGYDAGRAGRRQRAGDARVDRRRTRHVPRVPAGSGA